MCEGPRPTRCWNKNKERVEQSESWKGYSIEPIITVKYLWFMGQQTGVLYEIQDCILDKQDEMCPF